MKSEEIKQLFENFELAVSNIENVECWSARDLQLLLGYSQWRNFENTIQKAKESCRNAGQNMSYHFADVSKVIEAGKGAQLKRKMNVPENRPVADFLPTVTIKAKDFAAAMTAENTQIKNLSGTQSIEKEHVDNNSAVRKIMLERGLVPENLPPAEDVKKVERRLTSEEKKALKNS